MDNQGASVLLPACLQLLLGKAQGWRFCVAMGFLMNTRGLVQLIALNIALNLVRPTYDELVWVTARCRTHSNF
jgi:hypothetical protein